MGQRIEVKPTAVGTAAIFDTDRSITGQDGTSYASPDEAAADERFAGRLAGELFAADETTQSVWIASNTVVVTRADPWDEDALEAASDVIERFFIYY